MKPNAPQQCTQADPGGDGDGDDKCARLAKKIENIRKNIRRREADLVNDPLNLPERDDKGPLRNSRHGHRVLINKDWQRLKELEKKFIDECLK